MNTSVGQTGLPVVKGAECFALDNKGVFTLKNKAVQKRAMRLLPKKPYSWITRPQNDHSINVGEKALLVISSIEKDFYDKTKKEMPRELLEKLVVGVVEIFAGAAKQDERSIQAMGATVANGLGERASGSSTLTAHALQDVAQLARSLYVWGK